MEQHFIKTVSIVCDGDYCGDCPFCVHTDGTTKALCLVYQTKNGEPRGLRTRRVDRDWHPEYFPLTREHDPIDEPLRCADCAAENKPFGPNRKKAGVLYPTPKQMVEGEWLHCEKILDLAPLKGWEIQVRYGYATEDGDDGDVEICALFCAVRKAKKTFDLGSTEGMKNLDKLPNHGGELVMRWLGDLYSELVDVPESVTDSLYWEREKPKKRGGRR